MHTNFYLGINSSLLFPTYRATSLHTRFQDHGPNKGINIITTMKIYITLVYCDRNTLTPQSIYADDDYFVAEPHRSL